MIFTFKQGVKGEEVGLEIHNDLCDRRMNTSLIFELGPNFGSCAEFRQELTLGIEGVGIKCSIGIPCVYQWEEVG